MKSIIFTVQEEDWLLIPKWIIFEFVVLFVLLFRSVVDKPSYQQSIGTELVFHHLLEDQSGFNKTILIFFYESSSGSS